MNSKNICLFCLIIILSLILSSAGFAAGVRPMILNFEMEPGVSREFEFKLMPGSER